MNKTIFLLSLIQIIICSKFPIYENIEQSPQGDEKAIEINNIDEYNNYIKNFDYIIALFHIDWCGHCKRFLPIFYKASSYKIVNSKWKFLSISCSLNRYICDNLKINRFPTIYVFQKHKLLNFEPTRELVPLLQFLLKLSTDPIIEINSKDEFFKDYGYFSPIIDIPKDGNNENFITCVKNYANNEFILDFFFGFLNNSTLKKPTITFDNDGLPVSLEWDGYCENVGSFLYENKYPLISKIDSMFIKEMGDDPRIIVMLITYPNNENINKFINNAYKKISFNYRKYVFGYVNYTEDQEISKYFNIKLFNENEIKVLVYDYAQEFYYINPLTLVLNEGNEKLITENIESIVSNMDRLDFTSGSTAKDFLNKLGLLNMSPTKQIIVVGSILFGVLGILVLLVYCSSNKNIDIDLDDEDNKNLILNKNGVRQKIN